MYHKAGGNGPWIFPKTIRDSMEIARELSFRYLWVDRYCIDQDDKDDQHTQIAQMELIYSSVALTIIAAAGKDPASNLPSINGTTRTKQQVLRVDSHIFAQTLPHPNWSLTHTTWATRGWTYQEGILSHRRLIFTTEQVLWECDSMNCLEALDLPLDAMHTRDRSRFRAHVPPGSFTNKSPGSVSYDVMRYVSEYYERDLSYPSDAINAMRDIFKTFVASPSKVYHICGVPVLCSVPKTELNSAPNALEQSFLRGLFWHHSEPGRRRIEFPSWSWAGWEDGKIHPEFYRPEWLFNEQFYGIGVSIEDTNGRLHRIPERPCFPAFANSVGDHAKFIHIDAWTLD
ncbi:HET-domain-containing protein [Bimuria novae-zelandiae CBS 107.79]|uniref:HET-domain-containing protein n=1 Tax=Bimuria novae-zelandiae CBS 107.79 TaxID=1447943 RepID=A0A6A5UY26_9PLEO|nr:HET-domain-containing protein [Bimuria novae-zelandiae CBS 107.79]